MIVVSKKYKVYADIRRGQGHREFSFWKSKIPPLSVKIPENSRYENTPIHLVCKRKFIKIVIYFPINY